MDYSLEATHPTYRDHRGVTVQDTSITLLEAGSSNYGITITLNDYGRQICIDTAEGFSEWLDEKATMIFLDELDRLGYIARWKAQRDV